MSNRKNTQRLSLTIAAGLLACAGAVQAEPGKERFPIVIAEAEARAVERFTAIDADASGTLDLEEFTAAAEARGDEPPAWMQRRGKHGGWKRSARGEEGPRSERREALRDAAQAELFVLLDVDGDGALSSEEHAAKDREIMKTARRTAMFKFLDTNDDALLTMDELPSPAERLRAADADGNGEVTRDELRTARRARHQAG